MPNFPKNIVCETSTIADGNMGFRFGEPETVVANRKHFLEQHGFSLETYIPMKSEHGDIIVGVDNSMVKDSIHSQEETLEADVLATQEKDLALFLATADCQAISFYDPTTHTIALAHISRHTIALGLVQKTIDFLHKAYSTNPKDLLVHISPHIKKDSYRFKTPLEHVSPSIAPFITEKDGYASIDMESASLHELTQVGVQKTNITLSDIDTATSPNHFSHYCATRDNTPGGRLGTILAQH